MDSSVSSEELEQLKSGLYTGRLEAFVENRNSLAVTIRKAGDRAGADAVKAWRKPSRLAWALNRGVLSYPRAFDTLDRAVADAATAQGSGGDVRSAMANLRVAVRELSEAASIAAAREEHHVDPMALSTALLAVMGSSEAFALLRAGCLVEVPEGGGLDGLAGVSAHATPGPVASPGRTATVPPEPDRRAEREAVRLAADAVSQLKAKADSATRNMQAAKAELAEAEQAVREAERTLAAARKSHEQAQREANAANADLRAAEASHEAAKRVLDSVS